MKTFRSFLSNKRVHMKRKIHLKRTFPRIILSKSSTETPVAHAQLQKKTRRSFTHKQQHKILGGTRKQFNLITPQTDFITEEDKQIIHNQPHVYDTSDS